MEIANQSGDSGKILGANNSADIFMSVTVVIILMVMVIPIPTMLLDLLLSFNITFSLIILLLGMYIMKPIELSALPSILLLATLFRLSLNVASTRLILLHGNEGTTAAGKVINAFGNFVVGGNYVVGVIIFIILVVINFLVITKGAGRISEVAARFTLDAMPGKQMSIDADLNAGLINEHEAKERRAMIASEAEYYGAMDGANKFVRGDAIAGIIITLINIVAGFAIGVFQNKMSLADAAANYTLLTVGDGLVTQIPALIVSSAAGLVVSRAGSEISMGKEIVSQIFLQPRAIAIAAAVLFVFGLIPGLPTLPFMILSMIAGGVAYTVLQSKKERVEEEKAQEEFKARVKPVEKLRPLPPLDTLSLEVGYGLIHLVDIEKDGELLDRIKSIRRQVAREMGIIVPSIHIQDNMQLKPGEYTVFLKGNEVARGELMTNFFLAMNSGSDDAQIDGVSTREPTYGLPAVWIKEEVRETAMARGYTVVDVSTVLVTHLQDVIRRYAHELVGRQEVQQLLDTLKESHPKVVEDLVPNLLPLGSVVKVLQNLLKEHVPVRDLLTIIETLADWAPITKDIDILTEYVRQSLARSITNLYKMPDGSLPLITLDPGVEKAVFGAIQKTEQGTYLALEPDMAQGVMNNLVGHLEKFSRLNSQPILVCSARIRSHFKRLADQFVPDLTVLSYDEILNHITIQSLGSVELSNAN